MFYSHLQYCNTIWGNATERNLQPLERLQEKIIKIMCFIPFGQNEIGHLYNELGLLKLKDIHKLCKAKFIFKFRNDELPPHFNDFLVTNRPSHSYSLRNQNKNEYKCIWGKTVYSMKMMQFEGAKLWNEIPDYIKSFTEIKEFSRNYKTLLISQY